VTARPLTVAALLTRARALAGSSFEDLLNDTGVSAPPVPQRAKGFIGGLLEQILGADAGPRAEPDFTALGVELKTIPIDPDGKPQESTFVCLAPTKFTAGQRWQDSVVKRKLSQVLWVPIEGAGDTPFLRRRIGWAVLWKPTLAQENVLRQDWEELVERLALGQHDLLSARLGQVLQLRPKAAHGKVTTIAADEDGVPQATLPRGFYLRPRFTHEILRDASGDTP